MKSVAWLSPLLLVLLTSAAPASEWPGFRGPQGTAVSTLTNLPTTWSETENLKWKAALPGPGSSSPIVSGDHVFVTCYSGYGLDRRNPGNPGDLKRHLICFEASSGRLLWDRAVEAVQPEDPYRGNIGEHGYASNTPVTDGRTVYVFFGKTGVLAFDFHGQQLWRTALGTESSNRRWGSASSPILYGNLVIVNASEESRSLVALEAKTGEEAWRVESDKMELSYSTPRVIELSDGRRELVIAVPSEVWAFVPETGVLKWYARTDLRGNICPTPAFVDDVLYLFGGFPSTEAVAIRAGGADDVTETHILWTGRDASYVPSPLVHDGRLHWVSDRGVLYCAEPKTGKIIYEQRLPAQGSKPFYASLIYGDDRLYAVSRTSGTFVFAAGPAFRQLAHNRFDSDDSDFNGTPAVSDGTIFLRSNEYVYCVGVGKSPAVARRP